MRDWDIWDCTFNDDAGWGVTTCQTNWSQLNVPNSSFYFPTVRCDSIGSKNSNTFELLGVKLCCVSPGLKLSLLASLFCNYKTIGSVGALPAFLFASVVKFSHGNSHHFSFSSVSDIRLAGWITFVIPEMDLWGMFTVMQLNRLLKVAWKYLATCLPESATTPIGGQCAKTQKGNCPQVDVSMSLFTDTPETLIQPSKTLNFWAPHFHLQTKRKWTARKSCFK